MGTYKVIGIMSGTSMDGVDLAAVTFTEDNGRWTYQIEAADTIAYDDKWRVRLSQLHKQEALIYVKTDTFYGHYLGQLVNDFIARHQFQPDLIASHGHTIFHEPHNRVTAQVGSGSAIAAITGLPVVNDFRTGDVALGGQGAPAVPIGDQLLFPDHHYCLNLGGIANISCKTPNGLLAYDISPCNIVLNRVARTQGQAYDQDGELAREGEQDESLLHTLNELEFYKNFEPKSLGREWINQHFWPVVRQYHSSPEDRISTLTEHIAQQITHSINHHSGGDASGQKVLATGGGAFNRYLIERLGEHTAAEIVVPENDLVAYKEALVFALLGLLRVLNQPSLLAEVTGASHSTIAGGLHGDFSQLSSS